MSVNPSVISPAEIKLDLGCGGNKKPGFVGVDTYAMNGVDVVHDLRVTPWPWDDSSVSEAYSAHFLEHLSNFNEKWERVRFFNELYRIMKVGAQCQLIFPHWASNRYYGDPTHKEPFSEMGFYYLNRQWRVGTDTQPGNAPHADVSVNPNGYSCDFDATWGYSLHQHLLTRNAEYQQHALTFWREAAQDMIATITKRAPP